MAKVATPWYAHQQCHLSFISTDIKHLAGKHNLVADCLSRAITGVIHLGLDYAHMAANQVSDPEVQLFRLAVTGLQLENVALDGAGATHFHKSATTRYSSFLTGGDSCPWLPSRQEADSEACGSQVHLAGA